MLELALIDNDNATSAALETALLSRSFNVVTAPLGREGLDLLRTRSVDVVVCELRLPDMSGLDVLRSIKGWRIDAPVVIVTATGTVREAVAAMRLGAADFLGKPLTCDDVQAIVEVAADNTSERPCARAMVDAAEVHAYSRWARAVAPIVYATKDPRTTRDWSRVVYASPGTLRNWCRTANIPARRSLVFGRLLRAVYRCREQLNRPEELLDVVDLRTIAGLLELAGLDAEVGLPKTVEAFLTKQRMITEPLVLREIRKALGLYSHHADTDNYAPAVT
jgi:DNA-binding response OmpR family regulator